MDKRGHEVYIRKLEQKMGLLVTVLSMLIITSNKESISDVNKREDLRGGVERNPNILATFVSV